MARGPAVAFAALVLCFAGARAAVRLQLREGEAGASSSKAVVGSNKAVVGSNKAVVGIPHDEWPPVTPAPPVGNGKFVTIPWNASLYSQLGPGSFVKLDLYDTLLFNAVQNVDIYQMPDQAAFDTCDFSNAVLLADFDNATRPYLGEKFTQPGDYHYASRAPVSGTATGATGCEQGLKADVIVVHNFSPPPPAGSPSFMPPPPVSAGSRVALPWLALLVSAAAHALACVVLW